jgi:L-aminopeptidase/D-esterase-like protein
VRPGPRNLITDVAGIAVGNAEDEAVRTGVTVVLPETAATAAGDIRGGGPGTRETDLLDPACFVEQVHGLVLSGGSAFGLDAATGAMLWLAERDRGLNIGDMAIPIVPSAILYDLGNGGTKDWSAGLPYQRLARTACDAAGGDFAIGSAGAGYGAIAGDLQGGLGSASSVTDAGLAVGALVAVNARGYTTLPGQKQFWAWPFEQDGEFGGLAPPTGRAPLDVPVDRSLQPGMNTTIGVVATSARLTKAEAQRIAIMAQDGLARAIRPLHTPSDGDSIFVLATGEHELEEPRVFAIAKLGALAADTVSRAVARGVYEARATGDTPAWRDRYG